MHQHLEIIKIQILTTVAKARHNITGQLLANDEKKRDGFLQQCFLQLSLFNFLAEERIKNVKR